MVRLPLGFQKVRAILILRFGIAAVLVGLSAVSSVANDRVICASVASALRDLSASARSFSASAIGALPDDLEAAAPSPDLERAAYLSASAAVPASAAEPVGDYAAALIRLRAPLEDYQRKLEAALASAEACASAP